MYLYLMDHIISTLKRSDGYLMLGWCMSLWSMAIVAIVTSMTSMPLWRSMGVVLAPHLPGGARGQSQGYPCHLREGGRSHYTQNKYRSGASSFQG